MHFQRLQQADGAIQAAFVNVHVPAGLADRVSRRLAEVEPAEVEPAELDPAGISGSLPASDFLADMTAPAATASARPTPLHKPTERFSRRRLLVGFTARSTAAALLAAVWIQTHRPRPETPSSVLDEAMDFFGKDNQPFGPLVVQVPPPAEYRMSRDIVQRPGIRWRNVEKFPGGAAVAYDLPSNGGRATLYVLARNVAGLPSFPPDGPSLSTGGMLAAAWQEGNTLYVLVMEGDAGMYLSYLKPHGPLT